MPAQIPAIVTACVLGFSALTGPTSAGGGTQETRRVTITWADTAPLHARLEAHNITSSMFASYVERAHETNLRRVREGDLDHLIFYLLQSTHFTSLPRIEPALSAKALVDGLNARDREEFLRNGQLEISRVPSAVRSRAMALLRALDSSSTDSRLVYFRALVNTTFSNRSQRAPSLFHEYLRVMRFVYEKEFVAQRSDRAADAVAELYRTRGLSTDTAVETGYLVYLGLGILRSIQSAEPGFRIRHVLIVGPGLDLAPRTALVEDGPPESYQPWAVIDALLALGLSHADDLVVVGADINPRVVEHLRRARREPPTLTLVSGIRETDNVTLRPEYREYFTDFGRAIGDAKAMGGPSAGTEGHLRKIVRVGPAAARPLAAEPLDIVTERLNGPPFDLIVATNVLLYFDDVELMLAMSNVAGMLAPGGAFLHNESRASLAEVTAALGMPFVQSRHAIIADVHRAPAPLFDSVWVHTKSAGPSGAP